jgi:hypothetical protein
VRVPDEPVPVGISKLSAVNHARRSSESVPTGRGISSDPAFAGPSSRSDVARIRASSCPRLANSVRQGAISAGSYRAANGSRHRQQLHLGGIR